MEDRAKVKMIICDRRCLGGICIVGCKKRRHKRTKMMMYTFDYMMM